MATLIIFEKAAICRHFGNPMDHIIGALSDSRIGLAHLGNLSIIGSRSHLLDFGRNNGMFRLVDHRFSHYWILLVVTAFMTLPNLGSHSLWDVDEGVNAEASREMLEAGNWLVPTFNFELRTAKPIMINWVQMASYSLFGVNEFAARFPSVLAAFLTILLTYELGRKMFDPITGLFAGLVLVSAIYFCLMAHAATPDSTLLFFTILTLYLFWIGSANNQRWWFIPAGMASGLAVLTKGPIGLALPGLVVLVYLSWNRQLVRLWDRRLIQGILAFCAVTLPWYILVTVETRGAWPGAFFGRENLQRFSSPMENHSGPIFYHFVGLLVFFAPWSIFLGVSLWYGWKESRPSTLELNADTFQATPTRNANRFLLCWFLTYLTFFSIAATKLPNYVLPLYPAIALLTARFLNRWRIGEIILPRWVMPIAWSGLALVGIATILGLLIVGGAIRIPFGKMRLFPGVEEWAFLGIIPLIAVGIGIWFSRHHQRNRVIGSFITASILFVGLMAAFPVVAFDGYKAPRALIDQSQSNRSWEETKLGTFYYFQPSLVFYGQREVKKFEDLQQAVNFLSLPHRVYLFVPEPFWKGHEKDVTIPYRQVGRHFDFLKNCDILVLTNRSD
jgi:4-amino-4-deoxy-L-arabinose transferase-like glycosyltransferase